VIRFAFYIHNHQPAGNFNEVYEHAYEYSYLPLLKTFMKHKKIKFGIHNSGTLLTWISKYHPEFIDMLKETVKMGQSEILSSAYAEPILSIIPKRDSVEQIKYYNDYLRKLFNCEVKGLWLTERIWEPHLISTIAEAGIEYTLLDDTHFFYAGLEAEDLFSYYITEDEGKILKVFPISMKLRYLIPFHSVAETISFLKDEENKKNNNLKTLGDDGEKFGVWPGTYDWVHKKGWLDEFLNRIKREPWIETVFLCKVAKEKPVGRVYLPTCSYEEMGGWVLPAQRAKEYDDLKRTIDKKYYHFIHGGYFKNFLRKYPEVNIMQKRMLYVSQNIVNKSNAKLALWKGQCSCAYWHGIFGGLYLPHLREAVYKNLIEAENFDIRHQLKLVDFDSDTENEIVYSNKEFFMVLKPSSASFIEIDDRKRKMNLLNYLGRRKEKYHEELFHNNSNNAVKSIHEISRSKEKNLKDYLIYDKYDRGFGIDRILENIPTEEDFRQGDNIGRIVYYTKYNVTDKKRFKATFTGKIEKTIEITGKNHRTISMTYKGNIPLFGIEFSLGIFQNNLRIEGGKSLKQTQSLDKIEEFTVYADNFGSIRFAANGKFNLLTYPIETISSSEAGFEKNFQGFSLLLIFDELPTISIEL